jgi:hypothetical protein
MRASVPVPVSRSVVEGQVADALHEHARAVSADLVVMATHGRGGLSRFWLGSVADALVRRLPMPCPLVNSLFPAARVAALNTSMGDNPASVKVSISRHRLQLGCIVLKQADAS